MSYDIIVVGSGPGGYVTAIRASQLGMKTAIVERESLGGICLNWGCIPTKALLKSASVFDSMVHAESYGIKQQPIEFDFNKVIERSRGVADKMSKGVQFLMKKNKIDVINGYGKLVSANKISKSRLLQQKSLKLTANHHNMGNVIYDISSIKATFIGIDGDMRTFEGANISLTAEQLERIKYIQINEVTVETRVRNFTVTEPLIIEII